MAIRTELSLKIQNAPGTLGRICTTLSAEGVNVLALMLDAGGVLRLIVDNPLHAAGTLREQRFQVEERDVLYAQIPNSVGALARVASLIRDAGVNLRTTPMPPRWKASRWPRWSSEDPDAQRDSAATGL